MRRGGSRRRQGSSGNSDGGNNRRLDAHPRDAAPTSGGGSGSWRRQGSSGSGSGRRLEVVARDVATSGSSSSDHRAQSTRPGLQRSGGGGATTGSSRRGGRRSAPADLSEHEIRGRIQSSRAQLTVSLQLDICCDATLDANVRTFQALFSDTTTSNDDNDDNDDSTSSIAQVELAVFGLNDWEEQIAFDRVVAGLRRPIGADNAEATLASRARVTSEREWTYELSFASDAIDALWAFANALVLQLRSAGIVGRVLLPARGSRPLALATGVAKHSPFTNGDATQLDWSGAMHWDALAITDAVVSTSLPVQLVRLPAAQQHASASSLQYPALASLVDELLREHAQTHVPAVVVLRGIPGSGKSTFGRAITALCAERGATSCVVSADTHFVGARGYVFDVKRLGAAHERCQQQFADALESATTQIVVVDNTHTQRWEFASYVERARARGCAVRVLEMQCADLTTCMRMAARNSHGVAVSKVIQMHLRWEAMDGTDADVPTLAFAPTFEHALVTANPLSRSAAAAAASSVVYVGLFVDEEARAALLQTFPPAHANVFGEHVTLFYRPSRSYVRRVQVGERVLVRAVELVQDARGQSLRVAYAHALPLRNRVPHITLSTAAGVSAYYSNELLQDNGAAVQRTTLPPDAQFTVAARVGAAVLTQNQRVTTLQSPFDAPLATACGVITRVVALCVDSASLANVCAPQPAQSPALLLARLALREQLVHAVGAACTTHRVLCLVSSDASTASAAATATMLAQLETLLLLSPEHHRHVMFDAVVTAPDAAAATAVLHDACAAATDTVKHIALLTTLPFAAVAAFGRDDRIVGLAAAVSLRCVTLPTESQGADAPVRGFAAPFPLSLVGAMDVLHMGVQERTRHAIHAGMCVAQTAWHSVLHPHGVSSGTADEDSAVIERIDSSLVGLDAAVIDLCAVVTDATDSEATDSELLDALAQALTPAGAQHVRTSRTPRCVYFQVCAVNALCPPVFRVQVVAATAKVSSDDDAASHVVRKRLAFCQSLRLRVRALQVSASESCGTVVALLRAVLRGHCLQVPNDVAATPALDLLAESLVVDYLELQTRDAEAQDERERSCDGERDGDDAAADTNMLQLLLYVLDYVASWSSAQWMRALDAVRLLFESRNGTEPVVVAAALATVPQAVVASQRKLQDAMIDRRVVVDTQSTALLQLLLALTTATSPLTTAKESDSGSDSDAVGVVQSDVHAVNARNAVDVVAVSDALVAAANGVASAPSRLYAQHVTVIAPASELLAQAVAAAQDAAVVTHKASVSNASSMREVSC